MYPRSGSITSVSSPFNLLLGRHAEQNTLGAHVAVESLHIGDSETQFDFSCWILLGSRVQSEMWTASRRPKRLTSPSCASAHSLLNTLACPVRIRLLAAISGSRLQSPRTCVPPSTMPSRRGNMYRSPASTM